MRLSHAISAGLAGIVLAAPWVTAQEKKKMAKPIRAMRLTGGVASKPPSQEELKERYAKKVAESWVQNAAWIQDYSKAKSAAAESGKQIFAYFTRSYAP